MADCEIRRTLKSWRRLKIRSREKKERLGRRFGKFGVKPKKKKKKIEQRLKKKSHKMKRNFLKMSATLLLSSFDFRLSFSLKGYPKSKKKSDLEYQLFCLIEAIEGKSSRSSSVTLQSSSEASTTPQSLSSCLPPRAFVSRGPIARNPPPNFLKSGSNRNWKIIELARCTRYF